VNSVCQKLQPTPVLVHLLVPIYINYQLKIEYEALITDAEAIAIGSAAISQSYA